ncbi:leucine-rich repeat-containing protein [Heterostelium album PN500]|uniref:Leucine-rich repeat-containing protein n=1 Tax=Heterostelium pallidum (strain ATCC 26659 / Pp 5 / PN500) TaxID=670386 RepID=D3BQP5_HETP5|nr:leucine-rich repeat-containing protein [Heterostelium album PN500]EFA76465.1 leucine-rich repeat-containing protein [Heterostelium album PN500]|eukprot:XP_020428597.1 leucine-rich repeat-containing protein [Heterostelium album PN500]
MAEEMDPKFIEDSLGAIGGVFGEANLHNVWVEANKTAVPAASAFNKRLMVVGKYKMLSLKKGTFGKSVELEFHLYSITEINYQDDETVVIKYQVEVGEQQQHLGITVKASLEKIQQLILAIRTSYRQITCGFSEENMFKLNYPPEKLLPFSTPLVMSAASGYIDTYIAHSYFYKTISTLDYIRYIQALDSNETSELDYTHSPGNDPTSEISFNLFTAITSLRHNTFFKSLNLAGLPHANKQSFQPIANGLVKNPSNRVQMIDFSKNTITYPVMVTLCDCFSKLQHGLVSLDLSKCNLQPKAISILFESFERNFGMSLALKYLNLSYNKMGDIGSQALAGWMSKIKGFHSLQNLVLSNCALNFQIMGPPLRVLDVPRLNLSGNRIDREASKTLGSQVFDSVTTLTDLNLSECYLNAQSLEDIFVAFNRNRKIAHFTINLSRNSLGAGEASILSKSISGCRYLEALDISHNKLNCRSLMELINAIKNIDRFNLHELNIGNNYFTVGPEGDQLCGLIAQFITNFPTVRTLNLQGGRYPLGKSLFPLLETLVKNQSLREIDISDNGLTDASASIVGEMLRYNNTLHYLNLDSNQFGLSGWTSIAQPLLFDINRTLNHMIFSKTLSKAYTSTEIQNFSLHQAFNTLSKEKRSQLIQLFLKMQDKLAENRFEASLDLNSYVSEYATRVGYVVPTSADVVPLVPVPDHLSALPLPPSPMPENSVLNKSLQSTHLHDGADKKLATGNQGLVSSTASTGSVNGNSNNSNNNNILPPSSVGVDLNKQTHSNNDSLANGINNNNNTTTSAAPPALLPTQSSDWQPDENSEFEIEQVETGSSSYVNYESSEEEITNSEHESSDDKKRKKKSKNNFQNEAEVI